MSLAVRITGDAHHHHLDLLILSISPYLCDVHGVLGQSYRRMHSARAAIAAGNVIEGADWDYELPNLLSDSFTFNRFKVADGGGCLGGASSGKSSSTSAALVEDEGGVLQEDGTEGAEGGAERGTQGGTWALSGGSVLQALALRLSSSLTLQDK
jgi:hypothetical protein